MLSSNPRCFSARRDSATTVDVNVRCLKTSKRQDILPQPAVEDVARGGVAQSDSDAKPVPFETQTSSDDYCKAYAQAVELLLGSGAQADQVELEAREMAVEALEERAQRWQRLNSMD